jgi:RimJ/RimL family protein N-acetyltransferase
MTISGLRPDWQAGLPILEGARVRVREVVPEDAPTLLEELATVEVAKFIPTPPATAEGFKRFIDSALRGRADGKTMCFGVLANGDPGVKGLFSLRAPEPGYTYWNWGFVFGSQSWGTGCFGESARLVLDFAFDQVHLPVLEAWSVLPNGRAHGAMAKLGAEPELLRGIRAPDGRYGDFIRWTITPALLYKKLGFPQ